MKRTWIGLFCIGMISGLVWVLPAGAVEDQTTHAKVGSRVPMFELKSTEGDTFDLEAILNKDSTKAVMIEWFNHECPVCEKHAERNTIINIDKNYKSKGVVVLGIDSTHFHEGKTDEINKKIEEWSVSYPVLTDFDGKVGKKFGARTTPHIFIMNKEGILVYEGAIDNMKMPDEEGYKNYATLALDQLLAGETVETSQVKPYGCSVKYKG